MRIFKAAIALDKPGALHFYQGTVDRLISSLYLNTAKSDSHHAAR
jgi:hypothetical protein